MTVVLGTGDAVADVGMFGLEPSSADFLAEFRLGVRTGDGDDCASPDESLLGVDLDGAPLSPLGEFLLEVWPAPNPAAADFLAPAAETPAALDVEPELVDLATPGLVWPAAPVEVSAWATTEPLANAAPTPRVSAPARSHL